MKINKEYIIYNSCDRVEVGGWLKLWGLYYSISADHKTRKITIDTPDRHNTKYASVLYHVLYLLKIRKIKIPINKKKYSQIDNDLNYNHDYVYLTNGYNNPIQEKISAKIGKVLFYIFWYIPILIKDFKLIRKMKRLCNGFHGGCTDDNCTKNYQWYEYYMERVKKELQAYAAKKDILDNML